MLLLENFALRNIPYMPVTLDTSQVEMSPFNAVTREDISLMLVTLATRRFPVTHDTSHSEMSLLDPFVLENTSLMSLTPDTRPTY